MIQQLGIMLFREREKMGEKQKSIAEGIISISDLCRVERGELEVDYFTLQALFERLGKSIDKLELAVSCSEYDAIAYRDAIVHSIAEWDYSQLKRQIAEYHAYIDQKRPIHRQYMTALRAMSYYVKDQDYASCLCVMEQALSCTLSGDWLQQLQSGQRLCSQEIWIILAITYCRWKCGDTDGLSGQMEQLDRYILRCYTDAEEQVKVYPHSAARPLRVRQDHAAVSAGRSGQPFQRPDFVPRRGYCQDRPCRSPAQSCGVYLPELQPD